MGNMGLSRFGAPSPWSAEEIEVGEGQLRK